MAGPEVARDAEGDVNDGADTNSGEDNLLQSRARRILRISCVEMLGCWGSETGDAEWILAWYDFGSKVAGW